MQAITTTEPSLPTISTTSSPDSQSIDNKRHNDLDSDIGLIGRVPAPKRPARNRSPVDIKPSLIDSIPLVPEIVNLSPIDIKPVINTSPQESSTVHNSPLITSTTGADNERSRELEPCIRQTPDALPLVPAIATTSSATDSQSMNITPNNDSDSDVVLIGRVPAPKRPARNRSPVDIKPSLIDSIPLVPEIVN
ncbi:unnamed protein product, partial [Medioppia subpectinata]